MAKLLLLFPKHLNLLFGTFPTPPASAVIQRSSERVRLAPVRNFAGTVGSSFGNAAWTRRGRSESIRAMQRKRRCDDWRSMGLFG